MLAIIENDISNAEFLGQARDLRQRLIGSDASINKTVDRITLPAIVRYRQHPIPRQETIVQLARMWPIHMPAFGLLHRSVKVGKKKLLINEMRAGGNMFRAAGWGANAMEPGVSCMGIRLQIEPYVFTCDIVTLGTASLHALSRRYQRGLDNSDEAVLSDLMALARFHGALSNKEPGTDFGVPVVGGTWRGCVILVPEPILAARTYVPDD